MHCFAFTIIPFRVGSRKKIRLIFYVFFMKYCNDFCFMI